MGRGAASRSTVETPEEAAVVGAEGAAGADRTVAEGEGAEETGTTGAASAECVAGTCSVRELAGESGGSAEAGRGETGTRCSWASAAVGAESSSVEGADDRRAGEGGGGGRGPEAGSVGAESAGDSEPKVSGRVSAGAAAVLGAGARRGSVLPAPCVEGAARGSETGAVVCAVEGVSLGSRSGRPWDAAALGEGVRSGNAEGRGSLPGMAGAGARGASGRSCSDVVSGGGLSCRGATDCRAAAGATGVPGSSEEGAAPVPRGARD